MTHRCPAAGCRRDHVPDDLLMCGQHWKMTPAPERKAVWAAWRNGEGRASLELLYAQEAAIAAVDAMLAPRGGGAL
jgi:hypothetical protein